MRLLVCGGAGYIGSHMCRLLAAHGHDVAVADDFSTGHRKAVRWGKLYEGNLGDPVFARELFDHVQPEGVLHFAAKSLVEESARDPALYYKSNVGVSLNLLQQVRRFEHCPFVFSSTAAIFGMPQAERISEDHPQKPINPYGRTKLQVEEMLHDFWAAYGLSSVSFRYFNAAGAEWQSSIGESHHPETHLIPRVLDAAIGASEAAWIFGQDYDTEDGTCIRDYIHVNDLCEAHLAGLEFLQENPGKHSFNLGNGQGFSVLQVVETAREVTGCKFDVKVAPRRVGDPSRLVADSSWAAGQLGWQPRITQLHDIIESAWQWHRQKRF